METIKLSKETQLVILFWSLAIVCNAIMDYAQFRAMAWQWDLWHISKQFMFLFFALAITRKIWHLLILGVLTLVIHYSFYHVILWL